MHINKSKSLNSNSMNSMYFNVPIRDSLIIRNSTNAPPMMLLPTRMSRRQQIRQLDIKHAVRVLLWWPYPLNTLHRRPTPALTRGSRCEVKVGYWERERVEDRTPFVPIDNCVALLARLSDADVRVWIRPRVCMAQTTKQLQHCRAVTVCHVHAERVRLWKDARPGDMSWSRG